MPRALIFANGEPGHPGLTRSLVQPGDYVIAADGGARQALAIGLIPSIIIGDLDSLSETEVQAFTDMEVKILRFPSAKDETDLELALAYALGGGYSPVIILGAFGGRLDQSLGNITLLTSPKALEARVRLDDGATEAFFIIAEARVEGAPGDTVSLIPWGAPVEGVSTAGLAYPLRDETLYPFQTRGISNQMLTATAGVSLKKGTLLCVHIRQTK